MSISRKLKDCRIAVLAADGFEKVELSIPVTALKAAGAKVDIVSLREGHIRGVNLHEPASRVKVTKTVFECDPEDYDGLFIPGGFINPDMLRQSAAARDFVSIFDDLGKPIATLCHGPWVLASAGLVEGRTMTSWPGVRDDLVNAGAVWLDQPVVRDGNWVTSRGPQDLVPFVKEIIELFAEPSPIPHEFTQQEFSDPQHDEPPSLMLNAMKWIPRPSFRTAAVLGLMFAGYQLLTRSSRKPDKYPHIDEELSDDTLRSKNSSTDLNPSTARLF